MKSETKRFQQSTLTKVQELDCNIEMELSVWRPKREQVERLLNLEGFVICPHSTTAGIFTLISKDNIPEQMSFAQTEIIVYCNHEDDEWVTEEIKKKGGKT